MSGLGVPDQAFFTLQDDMLRGLADMLVREHAAVDTVAQVNYHDTTRRAILTYAPKLTHTHTHPFNGPYSGTTRVSRYQKGKTNVDFNEARDSEWQWHQLGHMQVCT